MAAPAPTSSSYAVAQVLPTSLGGDATRIFSTSRRAPRGGVRGHGSVLLERALGGVATLLLAAVGFVLAIGRYDVGAYLWIEAALVVATVVARRSCSSRDARARPLARLRRLLRVAAARAAAPDARTKAFTATGAHAPARSPGRSRSRVVVQAFRVLGIWLIAPVRRRRPLAAPVLRARAAALPRDARAVHDQRPRRPRGVLRQLPRQARTSAPIPRSRPGFLFFLLSIVLALPGAVILLLDGCGCAGRRKDDRAPRSEPESTMIEGKRIGGRHPGVQRGEAPRDDARGHPGVRRPHLSSSTTRRATRTVGARTRSRRARPADHRARPREEPRRRRCGRHRLQARARRRHRRRLRR